MIPSVDTELKQIAAGRHSRGEPVFEMHTSFVTTVLPKEALDFGKGRLATAHSPMNPGPLLGDPALRAAIAENRQSIFNAPISAENIIITGGARHALMSAIMAVTDPGAEVILMPPFFGRYPGIVQIAGAVPRFVALNRAQKFQPDVEGVEREWNPMTRAALIATPNNPTGTATTPANTERLQRIAQKNGGFLIIDETFEAFNFSQSNQSAAGFMDIRNNIVVGSYSETFSIPDHRIGYLIASPQVTERLGEVGNFFSLGTPMCVQRLAIELLKDKQEHLDRVVPTIRRRQIVMREALLGNQAIAEVHGDAGTFVWAIPKRHRQIDCRATVLDAAREHGILMKPGAEYGAPGCFRLGLGQISNSAEFARACAILSRFTGWRMRSRSGEEALGTIGGGALGEWGERLSLPDRSIWTPPQPLPKKQNQARPAT